MKILFITSTRLGDAVLSTGILDYLVKTYPEASFTIVCGPVASSIFDAVPRRDKTIVLKKQKYHKHWIDLYKQVHKTRWDIVVDLRNSFVSRVVPAKRRYIYGKNINENIHKVAQNASVLELSEIPAPRVFITEAQKNEAQKLLGTAGKILAVGPAANWIGKTWDAERFSQLIDYLTNADGPLFDYRVAVFAAPGEEHIANKIFEHLPVDRRINMIAKCNPGVALAALASCDYYIGNDSGLMHGAAAAGVKTLGLFGPSWPHIYGPYGDHTAYVATKENFAELIDFDGYDSKTLTRSLMDSLTVDDVIQTFQQLNSKE
jgi:heptosyltransferase-3